ncbi:MAG: hypothetical protein WC926_01965 [Candidatus Paceibacterota bacterium]|jgi:hypothetical protein
MDYQISLCIFIASMAIMVLVTVSYVFKIAKSKLKIKKETDEALAELAGSFKGLREEIEKQVEALEKKETLSLQEHMSYEKLKRLLDDSEFRIDKEIKDIKRELK